MTKSSATVVYIVIMALAQFMANSDGSPDPNTPAYQQNSFWGLEDHAKYFTSQLSTWNHQSGDSNCTPRHTINHYPYSYSGAGGCQPAYGAISFPTETMWGYDPTPVVGCQDTNQLAWAEYDTGYYPTMAELRSLEVPGATGYETAGSQATAELGAETYDAGYYHTKGLTSENYRGVGSVGLESHHGWSPWSGLSRAMDPGLWTPSPWTGPSWYHPLADGRAYAPQCIKQEMIDRNDVTKPTSGPAAASAPLIYQV